MKRFFSFLIVTFGVMFGFNLKVYALVGDVSIKSAEVVNKIGETDVIKEPNFKGLTIDLGVRFFDVGDSVTYRIVVENKGSSDVYINDSVYMFNAFQSINTNVKIYTTQSTKNKIISNSKLIDDNFVVVGG